MTCIELLTKMDSFLLLAVIGGALGLLLQRVLGVFIKPIYYPHNCCNSDGTTRT